MEPSSEIDKKKRQEIQNVKKNVYFFPRKTKIKNVKVSGLVLPRNVIILTFGLRE
jgi:hypothetical protein